MLGKRTLAFVVSQERRGIPGTLPVIQAIDRAGTPFMVSLGIGTVSEDPLDTWY